MDLQTVGEKLKAGHYATPCDFSKDVRLIFENSKKFKPNRDSVMYAMTDRLSDLFEEYFQNILTSYETQKTATGCWWNKYTRLYFNSPSPILLLDDSPSFFFAFNVKNNYATSFLQLFFIPS